MLKNYTLQNIFVILLNILYIYMSVTFATLILSYIADHFIVILIEVSFIVNLFFFFLNL